MILKEYTLKISTGVGGPARVRIDVVADFVLCTAAAGPFVMYIDGNVGNPMRAGRSVKMPGPCRQIEVGFDEAGWSGEMVIRLLVGVGIVVSDARVGYLASAQQKQMGAAEVYTINRVHSFDDAIESLGSRPGQYLCVIRNTGSDTVRIAAGPTTDAYNQLNGASPGAGLMIEPGEVVEFPLGYNYETAQGAALLARAAAGATYTVTWFSHWTS